MTAEAWIALAMFVLSIVGGTWFLSARFTKVEATVRGLAAHVKKDREDHVEFRKDIRTLREGHAALKGRIEHGLRPAT